MTSGAPTIFRLLLCAFPVGGLLHFSGFARWGKPVFRWKQSSPSFPRFGNGPPDASVRQFVLLQNAMTEGDGADDESQQHGPEQSQMPDFIAEYLNRESLDGTQVEDGEEAAGDIFTHLIAIPVDTCHELMLELESVQRAILYHCPVLVHACIVPAATRLPLLYVQAKHGSESYTTKQLQKIVEDAVKELVRSPLYTEDADFPSTHTVKVLDGTPDMTGANKDGLRPLMVPFATLELDPHPKANTELDQERQSWSPERRFVERSADNNHALYTVAVPESAGTRKLQRLAELMKGAIQAKFPTWKTSYPPDPLASENVGEAKGFRPRIPFMRLPDNWYSILVEENDSEAGTSTRDESRELHTYFSSDQGGNGISPILWGQWMDDTFGGEMRMPQVAVYSRYFERLVSPQRKDPLWTSEAAFSARTATVPLPEGNAALSKAEKGFEEYQEQRLQEARQEVLRQMESEESNWEDEMVPADDPLMSRTLERLESLYRTDLSDQDRPGERREDSQNEVSLENEFIDSHDKDASMNDEMLSARQPELEINQNENALDEWTQERIKKAIDARASRAKHEMEKLEKAYLEAPPIEENPVFLKYKNGTLTAQKPASKENLANPPFPSKEYCVGFWRMIESPTGFPIEVTTDYQSDNLILRVDGATAAGPILDQETRQKASGGTWEYFAPNNSTGQYEAAQLLIRLIIPPKKERVLVLQGELRQISWTTQDAMGPPVASSALRVPALSEGWRKFSEEKPEGTTVGKDDELGYCSGRVWIEDAVTGCNKDEVGTFSISKVNMKDPSQYTISIPRNVRPLD